MLVKVKNPWYRSSAWKFHQPEFFEYEGEPVKLKWLKPSQLALTTGDPEWPVRVLEVSWIVARDGVAVAAEQPHRSESVQVAGSKGQVYTVSRVSGGWQCTCSGFQFRRTCKHVQQRE